MFKEIVSAKAATLLHYTNTPVLVTSTGSETVYMGLVKDSTSRAHLRVEKEPVQVTTTISFHNIAMNKLKSPVQIAKPKIVAHAIYCLTYIVMTEAAPLRPDTKIIGAVRYKQPIGRYTQMTNYREVEEKGGQQFKHSRRSTCND